MAAAPRFVDDYLLYLLARASSAVSDEFHRHLARRKVNVVDWRILATLAGARGVTVGELADRCLAKQPTMTRSIARLEKRGLVERATGVGDRRQVLVSLTPAGDALARDLIRDARTHEAQVLAQYPDAEAGALKAMLRTVIERSSERA